ncbi:MAG: hypothetical protein FJY97_12475 [candidate division Zixibacteria bacterium]|nr:hypothetical protein [candidate division Zixibacteria bacterium]
MMRALFVGVCLITATVFSAYAQSMEKTVSDPKAVAIADQVVQAMGGQDAWNNTRYIRFSFFGSRMHHWDKWTGRYRVEWKRDEKSYLVLMNLNTGEGRGFVNGVETTDEERKTLLKQGRDAWINDTYWMLMPYKLRDPCVTLTYAGEETTDGVVYDKLHLSFDQVGNTPGDEYWAYINRQTHLMDKWVFLLQLRQGQSERSRGEYRWNNWQKYGRILLSPEREGANGQKRIMDKIAVFDTLPDAIFDSPESVPGM